MPVEHVLAASRRVRAVLQTARSGEKTALESLTSFSRHVHDALSFAGQRGFLFRKTISQTARENHRDRSCSKYRYAVAYKFAPLIRRFS